MRKTALITGITGQDGAYLARLLLEKNYDVHGLRQPVAVPDTARLEALLGADHPVHLHYADMTDPLAVAGLIAKTHPGEIYNLAAQTHVHTSFDVPHQTLQVNGAGTLHILDAMRLIGAAQNVRLFQASTSELFGDAPPPQNEDTVMVPRSPYAAAKFYAFNMIRIYREAYGIHASNGIMFNHESPLRGEDFVTRKIAIAVSAIARGTQTDLSLGNLAARRDWSHASDIMYGAWLMLQKDAPDDYILSSGTSYTVREFATEAFAMVGIDLEWRGEGVNETGIDRRSGKAIVTVDPSLFRPLEVENLLGNSGKAARLLGWRTTTPFPAIVREMVTSELDAAGVDKNFSVIKNYG